MDIKDVLRENLVILDVKATSKADVITEMVEQLQKDGTITDTVSFEKVIWKREEEGTTGIGDGIAIPHGKSDLVNKPSIVFARSKAGIDYKSLDNQPAHLFFMIATPANSDDAHLKLLSALSVQLMKEEVQQKLLAATTAKEIVDAFVVPTPQTTTQTTQVTTTDDFIVAVTGCATGIAHTYMAAEKLQETAQKMGVSIKVETNGSTGVENKLTKTDIEKAVGVIVAADINVEMNRFNGKKVISVPVASGIHKATELIEETLRGDGKVFVAADDATHEDTEENISLGKQIYKHLLSGVSHMLPFVVGGGIAIALAFMVDQFLGVPADQIGNLGSYNQAAAYLKDIGGMAFGFMLPVLAGYIAYSIADRPGLVTGFVAGGLANAGGAGFLGALLGGFIAGYTIVLLKILFKRLPKSLDGIKTILFFPVFGVLITGGIMLLVNVPMQIVNTGLEDFLNGLSGANAILLGALLAGMMAIDLGGPINKSAYVFGTGTLAATVATGGSPVMAAVMAGGMVPPLAIFVATTLFKHKFAAADRNAGLTNLILGASFITEGAIPFAAADPLRTIPSFVVGSSVTGAIVLGMGIKVMAPHGGLFVIFLVSNPMMYIGAIIIGAIISGIMLGLLRKAPVQK